MQPSNHSDLTERAARSTSANQDSPENLPARNQSAGFANPGVGPERANAFASLFASGKPKTCGNRSLAGHTHACHANQATAPKTRVASAFATLLLAFALAFSGFGCASTTAPDDTSTGGNTPAASQPQDNGEVDSATDSARATIADIPAYSGALCININGGVPGFTAQDKARGAFMQFSELDFEGRCGEAFARIGTDTVSNDKRGDISSVHPSGWVQRKYSFVDDGMLYNRCHLIAHQLCGDDANERNLITGTRTFNVVGMLYYEELVGDYVRATGNHVLYRVTPLFAANDLVARGVQMEAKSIEDNGEAVQFNVFVYNVEPGVAIDYVTGESQESADTPAVASKGEDTITTAAAARAAQAAGESGASSSTGNAGESSDAGASGSGSSSNSANASDTASSSTDQHDYILNVKNKKFHLPTCSAVNGIAAANRQDFTGTRDELIAKGYSPCGICKP
ncbi:DNA/RNA non-specific endonuclease [uncultured Senegalimassilia sp.]|uniref:DNA/RNA non-specific endonuclease n=1 Tax=uncultured Senegalimassilia sp. TaxID=1714350 RepID=UPI00267251EF|nr:DNA/RNA non-specific endonuclease [uncultured Senegalimassilia sp.]